MKRENYNVLSFFYFFKIRYNSENSRIKYYDLLSWHYVRTSLDGVDIALTDIHSNQTKLIAADFTPIAGKFT